MAVSVRRGLHATVALACAYEVAALASKGHLPTLSELQRRHDLLAWLILGGLAYHFAHYQEAVLEPVAETAADRAVRKARGLGLLQRTA